VATGLTDLVPKLLQVEGFAEAVSALARGESTAIDGAWGSSCALAVAALAESTERTLLVVLPRPSDLDDFAADLFGFLGRAPEIFPAWETLPQDYSVRDAIYGGRLRVLGRLNEAEPPRIVVTNFAALMQPVPSRRERVQGTRRVRVGDVIDTEELLRWLVERGFERVPAIEVSGEFSMHGGIFDLFPADAEDPVRIELFGNEVESIRRFDAETQRKLEDLSEVELTVLGAPSTGSRSADAEGKGRSEKQPAEESLIEALPRESWVVLCEMSELLDEAKAYLGRRRLRHELSPADRIDRAVSRSADRGAERIGIARGSRRAGSDRLP
jgi:transcription-repair coupling factor (superfamily II helicase)